MSNPTEKSMIAAEVVAPEAQPARPSVAGTLRAPRDGSRRYLALTGALVAGLFGMLCVSNVAFAPEMYKPGGTIPFAEAMAEGRNFAVFDLNINIREMRDEHIARMIAPPDVVVLGASHWQEAPSSLVTHKQFYNSHVHRDYYEDMLGVTEMWVRHGKLPKQMIIAIRDNLFTPVEARTDHLWLPIVPYYRAMAQRLGLEPHEAVRTLPIKRWREMLSISMLHTNVVRWFGTNNRPHATSLDRFDDLDVLLPGGSIHWAGKHERLYTPARSEQVSIEFAEARRNDPPKIDPVGVAKFKALLTFLRSRDVEVYLAHPPFNPIYFDLVKGTPYHAGLARIEQLTRDLASAHGLKVIGSFDPATLGCTKEMFIDAEHSNAVCLGKLMDQYIAHDRRHEPTMPAGPAIAMATPEATRPEITTVGASGQPPRASLGEAARRMVTAAAPMVATAGQVAALRSGVVDARRAPADASSAPTPAEPSSTARLTSPSTASQPNARPATAPKKAANSQKAISRSKAGPVKKSRQRAVAARRSNTRTVQLPGRAGSSDTRHAMIYVPRRANRPFPASNH